MRLSWRGPTAIHTPFGPPAWTATGLLGPRSSWRRGARWVTPSSRRTVPVKRSSCSPTAPCSGDFATSTASLWAADHVPVSGRHPARVPSALGRPVAVSISRSRRVSLAFQTSSRNDPVRGRRSAAEERSATGVRHVESDRGGERGHLRNSGGLRTQRRRADRVERRCGVPVAEPHVRPPLSSSVAERCSSAGFDRAAAFAKCGTFYRSWRETSLNEA
jgi:hypothetical protein